MSFLPKDYEAPKSGGNYARLNDGVNRFRVLSDAIVGWVYWTEKDGKRQPVRVPDYPGEEPDDAAPSKFGKTVRHFWAFTVWNYDEQRVQVLELTQGSIQKAIQALVEDLDWGDPKGYDLKISRSGEGIETEYAVSPAPSSTVPTEAKKALSEAPVRLEALFEGADPFEAPKVDSTPNQVRADDIPF